MNPDANLLAWVVLLGFPFVAFGTVRWARSRWPLAKTVTVLMMGGVMFLPSRLALDLPALPPFYKADIIPMGVLFACWFHHRGRVRWGELFGSTKLVVLMILGGAASALTNSDDVSFGPVALETLSPYDAFQLAVDTLKFLAFPVFLGHVAVRTTDDVLAVFRVMAKAALLYVPLVLFEIRMSPQLHSNLYGFASFDDWFQALRNEGFRPNVFMNHGLSLALWLMMGTLAAATLWKVGDRALRPRPKWATGILGVVLLACNSLGAALYAAVFIPLLRAVSPHRMVGVACVLACATMLYPALRGSDLVPVDDIVELAASHSPERAESLDFRFVNEGALLDKAKERIFFGWGGFGRNFVYDYVTGEPLTVPDGSWIILLGQRGLVGWFCVFATLLLPIFRALRVVPTLPPEEATLVGALALVVGIYGLDQIPNSFSDMLPFFYSGALASTVRHAAARRRRRRAPPRPEHDADAPVHHDPVHHDETPVAPAAVGAV